VTLFDARLRQLAADMAETMYAAPGVGLAATQVDQHIRLIVIDVSEDKDQLLTFVNPEIVAASADRLLCEEGCLSVPGVYDEVERPARVRVKAQDADGKSFEIDCEGLLAVCIQHEMDHLQGTLFIDHLSRLKRSYAINKVKKAAKRNAA
jgi:peptide deformylase